MKFKSHFSFYLQTGKVRTQTSQRSVWPLILKLSQRWRQSDGCGPVTTSAEAFYLPECGKRLEEKTFSYQNLPTVRPIRRQTNVYRDVHSKQNPTATRQHHHRRVYESLRRIFKYVNIEKKTKYKT